MTDFGKPLDRTQTASEKWNPQILRHKFGADDVLPFWVADMDFAAPPVVLECLARRAAQPDLGYEVWPDAMFEAVADWHARRHNWELDQSHVCFSHSTLHAIAVMLELFSNPGDGIIVQPPVYFQFEAAVQKSHRTVVSNPLRLSDGRYEMDFDDLEQKAAAPDTKILLLCNPHNPVGRVWRREELQQVAAICLRHNVLVISDEVHGDFVFPDRSYTHFSSLSPAIAQQSVSCLSAAKTFNIPAIANGFVAITNDDLRAAFQQYSDRMFLGKINSFTALATETAYRSAGDWLDECVKYVQANVSCLRDALREQVPLVKLIEPESTFMSWLDFRALNLDPEQLESLLVNDAKIALKLGHSFGKSGEGFARMAIGCPRQLLEKGVSRLATALAAGS